MQSFIMRKIIYKIENFHSQLVQISQQEILKSLAQALNTAPTCFLEMLNYSFNPHT